MHNLLVNRKSVKSAQDVENVEQEDKCNEEDVNFVNGSRFVGQRFGNSRNFSGNGQRNSYGSNQNSGPMPRQVSRQEF